LPQIKKKLWAGKDDRCPGHQSTMDFDITLNQTILILRFCLLVFLSLCALNPIRTAFAQSELTESDRAESLVNQRTLVVDANQPRMSSTRLTISRVTSRRSQAGMCH
jgi:hypothetical protein